MFKKIKDLLKDVKYLKVLREIENLKKDLLQLKNEVALLMELESMRAEIKILRRKNENTWTEVEKLLKIEKGEEK